MTPVQLKMARGALDLSIDQLATRAGLSHVEIARFESGETTDDAIGGRLRSVFEEAGVQLIDTDAVRFAGEPNAGIVPLEELSSANDE